LNFGKGCLINKYVDDTYVAAKAQALMAESEEEKLHSMLDEKFWGADISEEPGLVYGPFTHAFSCLPRYASAAWQMRNVCAHPAQKCCMRSNK
jgi:hypothetical protein